MRHASETRVYELRRPALGDCSDVALNVYNLTQNAISLGCMSEMSAAAARSNLSEASRDEALRKHCVVEIIVGVAFPSLAALFSVGNQLRELGLQRISISSSTAEV